jgi:hypothetical protein
VNSPMPRPGNHHATTEGERLSQAQANMLCSVNRLLRSMLAIVTSSK